MRKISGYIISAMLLVPLWCSAQDDTTRYPINAMKGVRVGIDLSRFALPLLHKGQLGVEACADVHIKGNLFAAAEGGWFGMKINNDTAFNYRLNGGYGKLGIDYNMLKQRRPGSNDIFFVGFRYAQAHFAHHADDVTVLAPFWPAAPGQTIPKTSLTAHWIELLAGIKAEVLTNFYIGVTFRAKFRVLMTGDKYSNPAQIPGYGTGLNKFAIGLNYYISYNIHF